MRTTVLTLLRGSRAALWAALVSLALFQAAFAGHTSQHVFEDLGESCEFCLKLDETKTSFMDAGSEAPLPRSMATPDSLADIENSARPALSTRIRAPPFV